MLLSLQHRFSHGFTLLTNYTWSHCISDVDFTGELAGSQYMNPYDRSQDRGNCNFDVRHPFNTSFIVMTPWRGRDWTGRLLGNWQLAPIVSARSGLPMNITDGTDIAQNGINLDRPNYVGAIRSSIPKTPATI